MHTHVKNSPVLSPPPTQQRRVLRLPDSSYSASPGGVGMGPATSRSTKHDSGRGGRPASDRSKSGYFVYLLVGVHLSYAEAKRARANLRLADVVPVTYERNDNGRGKCKTWLAASGPFERLVWAEAAQRQLAAYTGAGAVRVARGAIK